VCGKDPNTAALQDLLLHSLKGTRCLDSATLPFHVFFDMHVSSTDLWCHMLAISSKKKKKLCVLVCTTQSLHLHASPYTPCMDPL